MLVNLDNIAEWANGDTVMMKEIIRIFVENTPPTLQLLETAIAENDWENIARHSHKLKSSYGIVVIGNSLDLLKGIEQSGKEKKDEEKIREDFILVKSQYEAAQAEFDAFNRDNP